MVNSIGAAIRRKTGDRHHGKHREALAQIGERPLGAHDLGDRRRRQYEAEQHRHLIAAERHCRGDERECRTERE